VDVIISLVEGVVASFLAVALTELYLSVRKRIRHRPLRSILNHANRIAIITPEFSKEQDEPVGSLMATYDAIALAHALEICTRVNASSVLASVSRLPDDLPTAAIAIGGPYSNEVTSFYLRKYCGNFQKIEKSGYKEGYEVKGAEHCRFGEDSDTTWSFIVKLDPSMTDRSSTVILAWGVTAHATATAAYYLANKTQMLPWRNDNFFVALAADRKLGYKSVQRNPIDVSGQAFQKLDTPVSESFRDQDGSNRRSSG
jgi:hypothetical protein